jgi:hypothetical protein
MRTSVSLNGLWDWHIPGGETQSINVPSCYHCVGDCYYKKDIELKEVPGGKLALRFEGIHYEGRLWFNGRDMGEILPYTRFAFDITAEARQGTNHIAVLVQDITAEFGPTSGWENYGGISRDVFLDHYPGAFVSDTQWITRFRDGYRAADCTLKLTVEQPGGDAFEGEIGYRLCHNEVPYLKGSRPLSAGRGETEVEFTFTAESPLLWSCDMPHLYTLTTFLVKDGVIVDERREQVGFREFRAEGSRFLLNGVDTPLKGVCRHEMWGEHQGFSLTKEQIELDFKLIKLMGANYVRLVHYPHCEYTMQVCDRLGIMVSEEPGLWWSDFRQGRLAEKAIDIMERTVRRDRNHASVVFWLLFNECRFAGNYPYDARMACRRLDPTRLVSAANCMSIQDTKAYFKEQELDFYTYHAYGHQTTLISDQPLSIDEVCATLNDKPLVFTEWGGWYIHNNQNLIDQFREAIARLSHNRSPEPNLAGIAWWQWQDIYEFYRGLPGCIDGLLCDGLVDVDRNVKPMYQHMAGIFRAMDTPFERGGLVTLSEPNYTYSAAKMKPLGLDAMLADPKQKEAWEFAVAHPTRVRRAGHPRDRKREIGPVLPHALRSIGKLPVDIKAGRPVVFSKGYPYAELPVDEYVSQLYVFGQVTYCEGYPAVGKYGDPVMSYELLYADGSTDLLELKNGVDFSSSSLFSDSSRLNPLTQKASRVLRLDWDPNWEVYQVCWEAFPVNPEVKLRAVRFQLTMAEDAPDYPLLYGVTAELAK